MIYDSVVFFFFFSSSTPLVCLLHPRYHALVVCLLPINGAERSKELSLATSYNRDRAIECLKRAKIDNYKVSRTCWSFFFLHFVIRSTRNRSEREREREKERERRRRRRKSSLVIRSKDTLDHVRAYFAAFLFCLFFAFKVGRTKLLFRYWHSDQLHNLAVDYERKAVVCQKGTRERMPCEPSSD